MPSCCVVRTLLVSFFGQRPIEASYKVRVVLDKKVNIHPVTCYEGTEVSRGVAVLFL